MDIHSAKDFSDCIVGRTDWASGPFSNGVLKRLEVPDELADVRHRATVRADPIIRLPSDETFKRPR